jgi:glycosyltransferase involved in cell wall biosynthesis/SAM-dependent methyltransferase
MTRGRQDYDILMVVPGLAFNGATHLTASLGGSESAGLFLARELARLGHHVVLFANLPDAADDGKVFDGVQYQALARWQDYATANPHDVLIVQRLPELFRHHMAGRLNVLWHHDLLLGRNADQFKSVLWNVDRVAVLSDFMLRQHAEVSGLPEAAFWTTRNGYDPECVERAKALVGGQARNHRRLVYAARPERGVDNALEIFRLVLAQEPDAELVICGYDNTTPEMVPLHQAMHEQIATFGGKVRWAGHLAKPELLALYLTSGAYLYPTPSCVAPGFREISCITAMECNAAGLPMVASRIGALPETLGDAGVLVGGDAWTPEYHRAAADASLRLMRDDAWWQDRHAAALARAERQTWAGVAAEWSDMFDAAFEDFSQDKDQLARHFHRRSDIMAIQHLRAQDGVAVGGDLREAIDSQYAFITAGHDEAGQYDRIGGTTTDVVAQTREEPRYQLLRTWLAERPELKTVLDWGCAHGSYAINLSNDLPGRAWTGVDISPVTVKFANKFADQYAQRRNELEFFTVADAEQTPSTADKDAGVAFEVLEHVADPTALIDQVERHVRPGGKMILTVPYGPWEYESYDTYPHRAHVWEFDLHDLRDLFGRKRDVRIGALAFGVAPSSGDVLGWHVVEYTVDRDRPTGVVDLDRKCRVQRPRESVSAMIMAGPEAALTMAWCLTSLKHIADEIVVADTGMPPALRDLVKSFGARVVPGDDPKLVGFDVVRNQALAAARMTWGLWIDTDERLLGAINVHKYLRRNMFNGYGIRQHHFAVDTSFNPDLPVRLFRRVASDGREMKFFGRCHEHPELALNAGPGPVIVVSDVHIAHIGYLSEDVRRQRFARNYPLLQLDQKDYPDRLLQKHFLMRDNILLCTYEAQRNGGRITPEMRRLAAETLDLYRTHFLGKGQYAGVDSLEYYSSACRLLGLGAEVAFALTSGKDEVAPGASKTYRFATAADLEAELAWRARDAMHSFEGGTW